MLTIGRILRIRIISHDSLTDIGRLLRIQVININIRIGREGIIFSYFLTARICYLVRRRTPSQLLHTPERFHRSFIRFTFHNIDRIRNLVAIEISYKRMRSRSYPLIPMLVHQVCYNNTRSFVQIRIFILRTRNSLYLRNKQHLLFIRRESESFDIPVVVRNLLTV